MRAQKGRQARKAQLQAAAAESAGRVAADGPGGAETPPPTDPEAADSAAAGDSAAQPTDAGTHNRQQQARQRKADPKHVERAVREVWSELCVLMQRGEELAKEAADPDTHHVWSVVLRGLRSVRESAAAAVAVKEADEPAAVLAPFLTAPGAVAGQSVKRMAPGCSPSRAGHRTVARARAAEAKASEQKGGAAATTAEQPQQQQPPQLPQPFVQVVKEPKKRKRQAAAAPQSVGELSGEWAESPHSLHKFYRWLKERSVEETVRWQMARTRCVSYADLRGTSGGLGAQA